MKETTSWSTKKRSWLEAIDLESETALRLLGIPRGFSGWVSSWVSALRRVRLAHFRRCWRPPLSIVQGARLLIFVKKARPEKSWHWISYWRNLATPYGIAKEGSYPWRFADFTLGKADIFIGPWAKKCDLKYKRWFTVLSRKGALKLGRPTEEKAKRSLRLWRENLQAMVLTVTCLCLFCTWPFKMRPISGRYRMFSLMSP